MENYYINSKNFYKIMQKYVDSDAENTYSTVVATAINLSIAEMIVRGLEIKRDEEVGDSDFSFEIVPPKKQLN